VAVSGKTFHAEVVVDVVVEEVAGVEGVDLAQAQTNTIAEVGTNTVVTVTDLDRMKMTTVEVPLHLGETDSKAGEDAVVGDAAEITTTIIITNSHRTTRGLLKIMALLPNFCRTTMVHHQPRLPPFMRKCPLLLPQYVSHALTLTREKSNSCPAIAC